MNIILTVLIIGVLILVHELGHFVIAKKCGIAVNEFSLGMGPKLFGWTKHETSYSLRLLPIGGYVAMAGDEDDFDAPDGYNNQPVWKRFSVTLAGPLMNFIIAIVLFVVAFMYFGTPAQSALIGEVTAGSPAAVAGMLNGDVVTEINGLPIDSWKAMVENIKPHENQPLDFVVQRGEQAVAMTVTPIMMEGQANPVIGVIQGLERLSLGASIKYGFIQTYEFTKSLLVAIYQMATGKIAVDVSGPVGIFGIVSEVAAMGYMRLFLLAGMLSVNLGVMNLLPFPALDGSRLMFLTIEGIRRKPVDREKEAMFHFAGLLILFALMIFITYKDIIKLIS